MQNERDKAVGELRDQILGKGAKAVLIIATVAAGRSPLSITTVDDPELLKLAAMAAIHKAEEDYSVAEDEGARHVKQADLKRLRDALKLFVPGLVEDGPVN